MSWNFYLGRGLTKGPRPWFPFRNPDSLIERIELLILETRAGHNRLYDEIIKISKQLLSINIINQETTRQFFIFNYGK